MKHPALVFTGTRYRSVAVPQISDFAGSAPRFTISAGRPLPYEETGPAGWWRDLAELDFANPNAIARFIGRRGDPSGSLEREGGGASERFKGFAVGLRDIAAAWDAADDNGLSVINDEPRIEAAKRRLADLALDLPSPDGRNVITTSGAITGLDIVLDERAPLGLAIRARTLAAYLYASASHCLIERVAMRQCRHCGSWFNASSRRAGAGFCSASCRTLFYKPAAAKPQKEDS